MKDDERNGRHQVIPTCMQEGAVVWAVSYQDLYAISVHVGHVPCNPPGTHITSNSTIGKDHGCFVVVFSFQILPAEAVVFFREETTHLA